MGRVTRKKAAEIAEQLHVDEDAVLDMNTDESAAIKANMATPEHGNRSPLGEIAPNSAESREREKEPVEELKKSTHGRKGGKKGAAKGKKNILGASTITLPEDNDIVPDENESAASPTSEKAAEELSAAGIELQAANVNIPDRSQSPPSAAVRLTRSQLAKKSEAETESESKSLVDGIDQTGEEQDGYSVADNGSNPTIEMSEPAEVSETAGATMLDAPASPLPTALPNVIKSLRSDTPAKRSTSNKENVQPESDNNDMATPRSQSSVYDALEDAVIAAATPPRPEEVQASPKPEDAIAALDDLEDAVENVSRDIPEVQDSPVKKSKARSPKRPEVESKPEPQTLLVQEEAPKADEKKTEAKKDPKKPAPVVRTTKAAQARISMAQNKDAATSKAHSLGRPCPSTTLGRSNSVRQSVAPKSEGTAAPKRVPSNPNPSTLKASTSTADAQPRGKKEARIPHSKTRPISLSFPTPPPPPKSTKATTSSTFQLPGEAVAAKLKAAREARMAKEAEDADAKKKAGFKARPAPKAGGAVPSVRQTNASRARESIMAGDRPRPAVGGHKRASAAGGGSTTERARTASREPSAAATRPAAPAAAARPRPPPSPASAKVRPSLASTTTKPSAGSCTAPRVPSNGASTAKGKEVFARTANAKLAAAKSKAEKEGAAKKARAEAAERGRVKSREWAEKRKLRKMKAGVELTATPAVEEQPAVVEEAEPSEQTEVAAA